MKKSGLEHPIASKPVSSLITELSTILEASVYASENDLQSSNELALQLQALDDLLYLLEQHRQNLLCRKMDAEIQEEQKNHPQVQELQPILTANQFFDRIQLRRETMTVQELIDSYTQISRSYLHLQGELVQHEQDRDQLTLAIEAERRKLEELESARKRALELLDASLLETSLETSLEPDCPQDDQQIVVKIEPPESMEVLALTES